MIGGPPIIPAIAIASIVMAPVALVAVPVIGVKALYHTIRVDSAWHHSRNDQGIALAEETDLYMKCKSHLTPSDLSRLYHEMRRVEQRDSLLETLKWMKKCAKCIIPIVGVFWVLFAKSDESAELKCSGCDQHWKHWSDREAIEWHIQQLRQV